MGNDIRREGEPVGGGSGGGGGRGVCGTPDRKPRWEMGNNRNRTGCVPGVEEKGG